MRMLVMYSLPPLPSHFLKFKYCKLHGYTVHQQYPTLCFPTDAQNFKNRRIIKTF